MDEAKQWVTSVRGQVVAKGELQNPPPKVRPLQPGFIDLPQKMLDGYKGKQDASELGKVLRRAQQLRDTVDRVVILSIGGSYLPSKAIFGALCHTHHNELPANLRLGRPRVYFEGNDLDNDSLQDLFETLENTCVDPDISGERWEWWSRASRGARSKPPLRTGP